MAYDYGCTCIVNLAGATMIPQDPNDQTPSPATTLVLTDISCGKVMIQPISVPDGIRNEILALALTAISTGRKVQAAVDSPPPQCYDPRYPPGCGELDVVVD